MPKRLPDRCNPDSIREFRLAARQRYNDGLALATQGRRTGAIYVWGYSAEMVLKSAYFSSVLGLRETDGITWAGHLKPAISHGRHLGIVWLNAEAGHNVSAWAELLVAERSKSVVGAFQPSFGLEVQRRGQEIGSLWRVTIRYRKNYAYLYEVRQVREATEWFLVNAHAL